MAGPTVGTVAELPAEVPSLVLAAGFGMDSCLCSLVSAAHEVCEEGGILWEVVGTEEAAGLEGRGSGSESLSLSEILWVGLLPGSASVTADLKKYRIL